MANEVTATVQLKITNGGLSDILSKTFNDDQATNQQAKFSQLVGTAAEPLAIPADVTTPKWCVIENESATQTVTLQGGSPLVNILTIPAEGAILVSFDAAYTPQVLASAANTPITVYIGSA